MKKFKVIEEGVMSFNEMGKIVGGCEPYTCGQPYSCRPVDPCPCRAVFYLMPCAMYKECGIVCGGPDPYGVIIDPCPTLKYQ